MSGLVYVLCVWVYVMCMCESLCCGCICCGCMCECICMCECVSVCVLVYVGGCMCKVYSVSKNKCTRCVTGHSLHYTISFDLGVYSHRYKSNALN